MVPATDPARSLSEEAAALENWTEFERCYQSRHQSYVTEATQFDNYYHGQQWTEEELAALGDKPALTINLSKKTINAIYGDYAKSRVDFAFLPVSDATEEQGETLTKLVNHICSQNMYQMRESQMVLDGLIKDRGFVEVRIEFETNVLGDVTIRHKDPRDIVLDPEAKHYDPSTWSQVIEISWMSPQQITAQYGEEKGKSVFAQAMSGMGYGSESIRFGARSDWEGPYSGNPGPSTGERDRIRAIRVINRQHRKMARVKEFVDPMTLDISEIPESWTKQRIEQVAQKLGLLVRERTKERIRWTVTADRIVLFDGWSPYRGFTIVPFFPYFTAGRPSGVMRDLISPQDQLNKSESQELHIVNTTANSGWLVEAGSLTSQTPEELEQSGARTGLVVVYNKGRTPPVKIAPNQVPTGIDRISMKSAAYITDIPGASTLVGIRPSVDMSGVAMQTAQSGALSSLSVIFDNLAWTRRFIAMRIIDCVQGFYTEARVLRVTDWKDPRQGQEEVEINTNVADDVTVGRYDVVVSLVPAHDTARELEFGQAMQMRAEGVMIPDYHIILASNMHDKVTIAEEARKMQGLAPPTEEEQQMQQLQQQVTMQGMIGELHKLEAIISDLQAAAALKQAQAQSLGVDAQLAIQKQQIDQAEALQKLRAEIVSKAAKMQNDLELARIHTTAKQENTRYTTLMRSMDSREERQMSLIEASKKASVQNPKKRSTRS